MVVRPVSPAVQILPHPIGLAGQSRADGGVLFLFKKRLNPVQILSPSLLNRTIMLGEDLSQDGIELFLFSPRDVTRQGKVSGYVVKGREFRPDKKPVPRMNANWTYGTRKLIDRGKVIVPLVI